MTGPFRAYPIACLHRRLQEPQTEEASVGWTFRLNNNVDWTISFLGLVNQALGIPTSSLSLQGGVVDPKEGRRALEWRGAHTSFPFDLVGRPA